MKAITSRDFREHLAGSRYKMERTSRDEEFREPTAQQSKEIERVMWLFIAVLFALILLFGYWFWHKV